jgi:hypothetical protein
VAMVVALPTMKSLMDVMMLPTLVFTVRHRETFCTMPSGDICRWSQSRKLGRQHRFDVGDDRADRRYYLRDDLRILVTTDPSR